MATPNQRDFSQIVEALGPYLDQLVIAGAWCHRLLQFHELAAPSSFEPLMTEDTDVATPEHLKEKEQSLHRSLVAGGFQARLFGDGEELPVTKYYPLGDKDGMYVEFIAPLRGGGYKRNGDRDGVLSVAGITAEKLRYVELLLFEPWQLQLSEDQGFSVGSDDLTIQIANPASYLAQKVLTLKRRQDAEKRSKDALYVHDTLMMFGDTFDQLREQGARVLDLLPAKTQKTFQQVRVSLFENKDLVVRAANIAAATGRASPPSAETIADVCTVGLERIFQP